MTTALELNVYQWLKEFKLNISYSEIRDKLQQHSYYPTLRSVTDVLDEFGIENAAIEINKEKISEMPFPFLAHYSKTNEFVLIKNKSHVILESNEFKEKWTGTVLIAEVPSDWKYTEHKEKLTSNIKLQIVILSIISIILFSVTTSNIFSSYVLFFLIMSTAGFILSTLLFQHEIGINNYVTEQLCRPAKYVDCNAVLKSNGSMILNLFNLSDIVLVYFSSQLFIIILAIIENSNQLIFILNLISLIIFPISFYSIYYQWRVVRKWCTLCLLTVAILVIQFALSIDATNDIFNKLYINQTKYLIKIIFISSIISILWIYLIKKLIINNNKLSRSNNILIGFKNHPISFEALLKSNKIIPDESLLGDIEIGNPDSSTKIVIACNPFCMPCAKAHKYFHEIVCKINDVSVVIRFVVNSTDLSNRNTEVVKYLLLLLSDKSIEHSRNILMYWFDKMDFNLFKSMYSLTSAKNIENSLQQLRNWSHKTDIKFTPTIFINNYEVPNGYMPKDIADLIKHGFRVK